MKAKTQRTVHILARYELKEYTDIVCYTIHSSNGLDTYRTCYSAGRVNCNCRGYTEYGHCYHADEVKRLEDARREQAETARCYYEMALGF